MDKKIALNECEEVKTLLTELETGFLLLGEKLSKVFRGELWHCGQWDSWDDYCDYLGKNRTVISRIIKVYEVLIEKYGINPAILIGIGGWDTAYRVASVAKNKPDAIKLLHELQGKTPRDREIAIRSAEKDIDEEHAHEWQEVHLRQCKCGLKEKMYDS